MVKVYFSLVSPTPSRLSFGLTVMKKGNPRKEQKIESRYGYTLLIQYLAGINGKNLYKELYVYISEVAKLGKIIFQGEQKATEYTLDHLLAFVHSSRGNKGGSLPKTNTQ